MTLIFTPEAEKDVEEAVTWYEAQSKGLGAAFILSVDACMHGILRHPTLHALLKKGIRRVSLNRFPYSVFYMAEPDSIHILAVLHQHRNPSVWKKRKPKD